MLHTRGRGKGHVEHLILIAPLASPDPVDETAVEFAFRAASPLLPDSVVVPAVANQRQWPKCFRLQNATMAT